MTPVTNSGSRKQLSLRVEEDLGELSALPPHGRPTRYETNRNPHTKRITSLRRSGHGHDRILRTKLGLALGPHSRAVHDRVRLARASPVHGARRSCLTVPKEWDETRDQRGE